ncbi:MAG: hypothetical protein Q9226_003969 [Calogaya cf. arnoldii]
MTSSPDPENTQWVYDYIPHYRFNADIITEFLHDKWLDYDDFFVTAMSEVPLGRPKQGMGVGGSLLQHESLAVSGAISG